MQGTLLNVVTVLAGGVAGVALGDRLPERLRRNFIWGVGLLTLLIGVQMGLHVKNPVLVLFCLLLGGAIGEVLRLEWRLQQLGAAFQRRLGGHTGGDGGRISEAFVTASLIFCVGPLTILGSFESGLTGRFPLLALKSTLDGVTAMALASSLGPGVLLASGTVLGYQGMLTLAAGALKPLLSSAMIEEMTAVGGLLILGIGLKLLDIKELPVANYLPSLAVVPTMVWLQGAVAATARGLGLPA